MLYDVTTGNRVTEVGDEFDAVIAADISADQSIVALGGPGKVVKMYSIATGASRQAHQEAHRLGHRRRVQPRRRVARQPATATAACSSGRPRRGNDFYTLPDHKAAITSVCFRGDSNVLASSSEDGTVILWDMSQRQQDPRVPPQRQRRRQQRPLRP